MKWYIGQKVYCLAYGHGTITRIKDNNNQDYPIIVDFWESAWGQEEYTLDGKLWLKGQICLYPAKPEIILPKWQPKPGEWCWFWDERNTYARLAKFAIFKDDEYYDHTHNGWENCAPFVGELPEYLKEVEK